MSQGDGRALERTAEALADEFGMKLRDVEPFGREYWLHIAAKVLDAYLDALLSELPEEAVEAAAEALAYSDPVQMGDVEDAQASIRAFLLSLRSSSRGAETDEG